MKKRLFSFALMVIMLITLLPVQVEASEQVIASEQLIASDNNEVLAENNSDCFYVVGGNIITIKITLNRYVPKWNWTIDDSSVASIEDVKQNSTIESSGVKFHYYVTIKGLKGGSTELYFRNESGIVLYSTDIVVNTPVSNIEISQESAYMEIGDSLQLKAVAMPSDAYDTSINWTSSNEAVAVVTSEGVVTTCGEGTAIIYASSSHNSVTAKCMIYSGKLTKSIAISNSSIKLTKASPTEELIIGRIPVDASFPDTVYTSSDPEIASVDEKGIITGHENGKVTITATSVDTGVSASIEVVCSGFTRRLTKIKVVQAPSKVKYYLGEQLDISGLVVKGYYNDGSEEIIPNNKIVIKDKWYEDTIGKDTYRVNQYVFDNLGKHTINLSYMGKEGSFTVEAIKGGTIDFGIIGKDITWLLYQDGRLLFNGSGEMFQLQGQMYWEWLKYSDKIKSAVFDEAITVLDGGLFDGCSKLSKVKLPPKITEIGNSTFSNCSSLKSITIPSSVIKIEGLAFFDCTKLEKVTLPKNLMSLGEAVFSGCENLVSIDLGKRLTRIPRSAFFDCAKLKSISIPNTVKSIESGAFSQCYELSEIALNEGLATIGEGAFGNCWGLKSIVIPDSVREIGDWAFSNCNLKKVIIGDGVTTIGEDAFVNNEITYLKLGDSVKTIKYEAFRSCDFKSIYIPKSVKVIEDRVFWNCLDFSNVYYEGSKAQWNKIKIGKDNEELEAAKMHYNCPRSPEVSISNVASNGKIKLAWGAVDGASEYIIYRSTSKSGSYTKLKTTSKTSYTDTSAKAGVTYYYKVKAVSSSNSSATSEFSSIVSSICDLARPTVKSSNVSSSGKIQLTWKAIDGASKYYVYRATSKNGQYTKLADTKKTSYTDTSAKTANTYYYKVIAAHSKNSGANSASSSIVSSICKLPRAVVNTSNVASTGKIQLTWKAIDGASKYYVYRATSKNGQYTKLADTKKTSYTDTSAKTANTYYYKVIAAHSKNSGANSASSSIVSSICKLPRAVVNASNVSSSGKIKLTWKSINGASKYYVYRASSKNGEYKRLAVTEKTAYIDTSSKVGKTYYYKVKAISSKTSTAHAASSSVVSCTCKLSSPTVTLSRAVRRKVKVAWKNVQGASEYWVYRSTSKNGKYTKIKVTSKSGYTDSSVKAGNTYYYKVKAVYKKNTSVNSANSSVKSIKIK
ncbi:leucine-rich repeat protein [Alloiococcus sp. CFN-8]|uniref:leucine-rich repeat protein n=1 Tax=Alloiococcus sp. CFN-8 TaxID=3416081 RepID=UPI003CEBFEF3